MNNNTIVAGSSGGSGSGLGIMPKLKAVPAGGAAAR